MKSLSLFPLPSFLETKKTHHPLIQKHKNSALQYFLTLGLPQITDNDWRFSKLPEIDFAQFTLSQEKTVHCASNKNIFIGSLDEFAQQFPEKVADCFVQNNNHIARFVDSYFQESLVIFVPAGMQINEPICLQTKISKTVAVQKIVVIVGSGAGIEIRDFVKDKKSLLYKSVLVIAHDNAHVTFTQQESTKNIIEYAYYQFILHKNSQLIANVAYRECKFKKLFFDFELHAYANAQMKGGYLLKNNQTIDIVSQQKHMGEHSSSSVRLHGALYDAAYASYQGTIAIAESGHKTNAEQYNKTIILSDKAHAVSVPNLEVKTNDVQCRHGSAVGRFDAMQLFYMQSRGFKAKSAENLLLHGFFAVVNQSFLFKIPKI